MKKLFFLIILMFLFIACDESNTPSGTHHEYDPPSFEMEVVGNVGFSPLETTFAILESTIQADKPYTFTWDFGDGSGVQILKETEVVHIYEKQGIYTAKVTIQDNDGEVVTKEVSVRVKSNVDVSLQSINTDKITIDPGDDGDVSVKVINLGNEEGTIPFGVKLFFSSNQVLDEEDILIGEKEISTIQSGGIITETIEYSTESTITPGVYWLIAKVDTDNIYIEADESNNTKVFSSSIEILGGTSRSPDLSLSDLILPQFFIKDDQFSVGLDVINNGLTTASPFSYKIVLSDDNVYDEEGDTVLKYDYISSSLAAGEHTVQNATTTINTLGEYFMIIVLDPTNDIKEANEDNNVFISEKISVGLTLDGIDLFPYNTIVTPTLPIQKGRTITLSYSVKNRGNRPAIGGNIRMFLSKNQMIDETDYLVPIENPDDGNIPTLGDGRSIDKSINIKIPSEETFEVGEYYVLIDVNYEVDGTRPVDEVDTTNNMVASRKFEVVSSQMCTRDIAVENVQVLPNQAFEGSPYTIKFDLNNPGIEATTSFIAKVYAGPANVDIMNDTYLLKNYNIPLLDADSINNKTIVAELPSSLSTDSYCITINADITGIIGECDEENNLVRYCFDVTTRGNDNDISVSDISTDSPTYTATTEATISFTVTNSGQENVEPLSNTATFYCSAYFSPNETLETADFKAAQRYIVYNVKEGESNYITDYKVTIPGNMGNRSFKIFIKCDDENIVPEWNENNNIGVSESWITVTGSASGCNADTFEANETFGTASLLSPQITTATLCDQDADWYKLENLSSVHKLRVEMPYFGGKDIDLKLYKQAEDGTLTEVAASILTGNGTTTVPIVEAVEKLLETEEDNGTYYLNVFPKTATGFSKTNYTLKVLYSYDLELLNVSTDLTTVNAGETLTASFTVNNLANGTPNESNIVTFTCAAYFSPNSTFETVDFKATEKYTVTGLAEGQTATVTDFAFTVPANMGNRQFKLFIKCDDDSVVPEFDELNNIVASIDWIAVSGSTAGCNADSFELNENFQTANVITPQNLTATLCDQDADWYKLENLGLIHKLRIEMPYSAGVDVDLKLYKDNGEDGLTEIASSVITGLSGTEVIEKNFVNMADNGDYYINVYPKTATTITKTNYDLKITYNEVGGPGIDLFVKDFLISTGNIKTGEQFTTQFTVENLKNDASGPYQINFYLSDDATISEDDIIINNATITKNSLGILESENMTINLTLTEQLEQGQYYFIAAVDPTNLIGETNESNNNIIKQVTVNRTSTCEWDSLEPNALTPFQGKIVTNGNYSGLIVCADDADIYFVYLMKGTTFNASVAFTSGANLDLYLYSPNSNGTGTALKSATSTSTTTPETLSYTVPTTGTTAVNGFYVFYVKKTSTANSGVTYSMTLSGITDGYNLKNNLTTVLQPYLEAGEDASVSYSFESISTRNLVTPFKYNFYLSEDAVFSDTDRLIASENYTGIGLDESISKQFKITLPSDIITASYYLFSKVDGGNAVTELNEEDNIIRQRVSISGICQADRFEQNDTIDYAEENSMPERGRHNNLSICPSDIDFFAVYLRAGDQLFARIYLINSQGDLDLRLYDRDGTTIIANSNTTSNKEEIVYTATNSGIYYLRVRAASGSAIANNYDLEILVPTCDGIVCDNSICKVDAEGLPYCDCNEGFLPNPDDRMLCYVDPCFPNTCGDFADCSVGANLEAICTCINNAHWDTTANECISNTRTVNCTNIGDLPLTADWSVLNPNGMFTQTWNDTTETWLPADDNLCVWVCDAGYTGTNCDSCDIGYHLETGVCVLNTKLTACANTAEKPVHAIWSDTNVNGQFAQTWDETEQKWLPETFACTWECAAGYLTESCNVCDETNFYYSDGDDNCIRDFILNGSFESSFEQWKGSATTVTDANMSIALEGRTGNQSLKLVNATATSSNHKRFSSQPYTITANTTYTCTAYVKGKGKIRFGFMYDSTYNYANYFDINNHDEWTQITGTFNSTVNKDNFQLILSLYYTLTAENQPDFILVDDVKCTF